MRRKEKEITEKAVQEEILRQAEVGRLGTAVDGVPYVVPMNFCYVEDTIYLHSFKDGKKIKLAQTDKKQGEDESEDKQEKQGLLTLAMAVAQMAQGSGQQSTMLYASSSMSIESTQMMMTDTVTSAYTNAGADPAQSGDPGAGGLDVTA